MLQVNQVIHNRYQIIRLVGQGGFGAVYQVWDTTLKLTCALKENFETSTAAQRQFLHEATILAKLRHPNLPRVTDHFTIPGQGQYLVMDYVEGVDLKTKLEQNGAPLPVAQVIPWINQMADALAYLHAQKPSIIHRDLKPENIIITPADQAMLVDFGVAKIYDPHLKTTVGARAVTAGFSPPEQYGQGTTDARSDIYALGATLYTLVTNQEPVESIQRTLRVPLTSPRQLNPAVSPSLDAAIRKAMEPVPADRFQRMEHFKSALAQQQNMAPLPQPAFPRRAITKHPINRRKGGIVLPRNLLLVSGMAAILLFGLLVIFSLVRMANKPSPIPEVIPTSTQDLSEQQTLAAIQTGQAAATQTSAEMLPAVTPIPTNTRPAALASATRTRAVASKTPINPGAYTCVRLVFLSDITVPDGTVFSPGSDIDKNLAAAKCR